MTDPKTLAARLSEAQRTCLLDARYLHPALGAEGWEIRGRTANSLSLRGLAAGREIRSLTGKSRRGLALTPLGEQVRLHLKDLPQ